MHRILVCGQHKNARRRLTRQYPVNGLQAADPRHRDVHDHYIRPDFGKLATRVLAAFRFGNHFDVGRSLQQKPEPHAHDRMIIHQHYADSAARCFAVQPDSFRYAASTPSVATAAFAGITAVTVTPSPGRLSI